MLETNIERPHGQAEEEEISYGFFKECVRKIF